MLETHLREPAALGKSGFMFSAWGPLQKTEDSQYISHNDLHKSSFQHNTTYGDFNDLTRTTASYKTFFDKAFNIANDGYQKSLASMVDIQYFDKKTSATHERSETLATWNKCDGSGIKNEKISNK